MVLETFISFLFLMFCLLLKSNEILYPGFGEHSSFLQVFPFFFQFNFFILLNKLDTCMRNMYLYLKPN